MEVGSHFVNLYYNAKKKIACERRGICVPIMTPRRLRVVERTVVLTHPRWASSKWNLQLMCMHTMQCQYSKLAKSYG